MKSTRRFLNTVLVLAALAVSVVAFQNCDGVKFSNSSSSAAGSGEGYGGKVFAEISATTCGDGSRIATQIELTPNAKAYLVRENCAAIAPKLVNVTMTPGQDSIVYEGREIAAASSYTQTTLPLVIEGESMAVKGSGADAADGLSWWLTDGDPSYHPVLAPASRTYTLELLAWSEVVAGEGANVQLYVDGTVVATTRVDATSAQNYTFDVSLTAGPHEIGIGFDNDVDGPSGDRNLFLDRLTLR